MQYAKNYRLIDKASYQYVTQQIINIKEKMRMGVEYSNKMTVLGETEQIERFINNEKHSEYLIKYEQKTVEYEYGDSTIEIEEDDYSRIIDEYKINDNKFVHYSSTWKHNPVEWLIEMSSKYHELYFKLDSKGDNDYRFRIELENGEIKLFLEQELKGYKSMKKDDGTYSNVDIWEDIVPTVMNPRKKFINKLKRRLVVLRYTLISFFRKNGDIEDLD